MIDLVLNDRTGMSVIHDEPDLTGIQCVVLMMDHSIAFERIDGSIRRSPLPLPSAARDEVRRARFCQVIRLCGRAVQETRSIPVLIESA